MASTSLPKQLSNRLLKTVPFLKRWASNPSLNAYQVAQQTGIAQAILYQAIIPGFLNIYHAASKQEDFPSSILTYYNQHGNPEPNYNLTEAEVHALKLVFEREIARKPEQMQQAYYSNPAQQTFAPPEQGRPTSLGTNASLISYIMERIRLAPIWQIRKFVELFEMSEDYYMTHPENLKELFKSQFGPLPGEIGFNHFMLTQPSYVYGGGQAGAGGGYPFLTGYGSTSPMGIGMPAMGMGIPGMGGMSDMPQMMPGQDTMFHGMMMQNWQNWIEDQKDERRMTPQANMTSQMVNYKNKQERVNGFCKYCKGNFWSISSLNG